MYEAIITDVGNKQIANAIQSGAALKITKIAVSDKDNGLGPTANRTSLINQVWVGSIDSYTVNGNVITASATIPNEAGPFIIKEIGLFDENNNLIALGVCPSTTKNKGDSIINTLEISISIAVESISAIEVIVENPILKDTTKIYIANENSKHKDMATYICDSANAAQVINSAIASAKGGTEIIILDGTYYLTEPIEISKSNIKIKGIHRDVVTIEQVAIDGETTSLINNTASGTYISDIMFVSVDVTSNCPLIVSTGNDLNLNNVFIISKQSDMPNDKGNIVISGNDTRIMNCRMFKSTSSPALFADVLAARFMMVGTVSSGADNISVNFGENIFKNSSVMVANSTTDIYIAGVKEVE